MRILSCLTGLLSALAALSLGWAGEAFPVPAADKALSVFDGPALQARQTLVTLRFLQLGRAKRLDEAEALLAKAVKNKHFDTAVNRYNLARVQALRGKADDALANLAAAVKRGYADAKHLREDKDLASLQKLPRFAAIAADAEAKAKERRVPKAKPLLAANGVAKVEESNTEWLTSIAQFVVLHAFPKADANKAVTTLKGPAGDLLREWYKEGSAAGLHGVLYDNHDRGHSKMNTRQFPRLTVIEHCEAVKKRSFDYGFQRQFLHNAPTLGNSSTALVRGSTWGSQTRYGLRGSRPAQILARQYVNNHLYFYPEHKDHDADGYGDVFHANVPYVITSQGSSGSDRAFMEAAACIIAAFRPETQRALIAKKLLSPTVQMVFRANRKVVVNPSDYLTGKAHPMVFDKASLDLERMVRAAHAITPTTIPPLIRLRVVDEATSKLGVDYFESRPGEALFDTISAVSRIARASRWQWRMALTAEDTKDPNDRPLTFQWKLLRGDPALVQIKPLGKQGARVELRVAWHDRRPVEPGSAMKSSRVDIAVFANNGTHTSAPAFVSYYFPANETRVYGDDHRILSIDRVPSRSKEHYVDPALVTPATWRDDYRYDGKGALIGWTRTRGKATEEFTRHGALVIKKDSRGRPLEARTVRYVRKQKTAIDWPTLEQQTGSATLVYTYASDDDRLGTAARKTTP